jgi:hypothetical protein
LVPDSNRLSAISAASRIHETAPFRLWNGVTKFPGCYIPQSQIGAADRKSRLLHIQNSGKIPVA